MTVSEALAELARKSDPTEATCLRCCAIWRVQVMLLASFDKAHRGFEVHEEAVRSEVAAIFQAHPELAGRFEPTGLPLGVSCEGAPVAVAGR